MAGFKVTGLEELQKKLKDNVNLEDVKRVVKTNGSQLQRKMQNNADFTQGYQTGTTKRSITLEIDEDGMSAAVGPGDEPLNPISQMAATEYSPYVEYGTRFMDAQPFVRPSLNEQKQKFKSDMQKLFK